MEIFILSLCVHYLRSYVSVQPDTQAGRQSAKAKSWLHRKMQHYSKPDAAKNTVSTESFLSQHLDGTCIPKFDNRDKCEELQQVVSADTSACDVCIKPPEHTDSSLC